MAKGSAVRGSASGRPIMALLDLIGRRWTLRILWELRPGPLTARALRARCDEASPTILHSRLVGLRHADLVVVQRGTGYELTARGREFIEAFLPLYRFAEDWDAGRSDPNN
jgi:DNA-binding HxlR family transcriptional regulator